MIVAQQQLLIWRCCAPAWTVESFCPSDLRIVDIIRPSRKEDRLEESHLNRLQRLSSM